LPDKHLGGVRGEHSIVFGGDFAPGEDHLVPRPEQARLGTEETFRASAAV
jgi:hypothetical protein